jgi:hypothetical protein
MNMRAGLQGLGAELPQEARAALLQAGTMRVLANRRERTP